MSSCIYCIDNDIIKKLATFQLFDKTLQLFDASSEQVNILETAQYKFEGDWQKFEAGKSRKPEDSLINYKQVLYLTKTYQKYLNLILTKKFLPNYPILKISIKVRQFSQFMLYKLSKKINLLRFLLEIKDSSKP